MLTRTGRGQLRGRAKEPAAQPAKIKNRNASDISLLNLSSSSSSGGDEQGTASRGRRTSPRVGGVKNGVRRPKRFLEDDVEEVKTNAKKIKIDTKIGRGKKGRRPGRPPAASAAKEKEVKEEKPVIKSGRRVDSKNVKMSPSKPTLTRTTRAQKAVTEAVRRSRNSKSPIVLKKKAGLRKRIELVDLEPSAVKGTEQLDILEGRRFILSIQRCDADQVAKATSPHDEVEVIIEEGIDGRSSRRRKKSPILHNSTTILIKKKRGRPAANKSLSEVEVDSENEEDNNTYTLEVCVDNAQSLINAVEGGASRIELCSALSEQGLTPTVGLLKLGKKVSNIPIFVMIRPRCGDFIYSEQEMQIMEMDIRSLKAAGADGFVFGMLDEQGDVDEEKCRRLLKATSSLPTTFHRAFDLVRNPMESLEKIVDLGFQRILTSGLQSTAELGIPLLKQLVEVAHKRIVIMAGAGVNLGNIEKIVQESGVTEVHGSARVKVTMGKPGGDDTTHLETSVAIVKEMVSNFETACKALEDKNLQKQMQKCEGESSVVNGGLSENGCESTSALSVMAIQFDISSHHQMKVLDEEVVAVEVSRDNGNDLESNTLGHNPISSEPGEISQKDNITLESENNLPVDDEKLIEGDIEIDTLNESGSHENPIDINFDSSAEQQGLEITEHENPIDRNSDSSTEQQGPETTPEYEETTFESSYLERLVPNDDNASDYDNGTSANDNLVEVDNLNAATTATSVESHENPSSSSSEVEMFVRNTELRSECLESDDFSSEKSIEAAIVDTDRNGGSDLEENSASSGVIIENTTLDSSVANDCNGASNLEANINTATAVIENSNDETSDEIGHRKIDQVPVQPPSVLGIEEIDDLLSYSSPYDVVK